MYVINGKDIVFAKIVMRWLVSEEKWKITSFVMSYTMIAAAEPL